jgi:uncharacterized SAM-binding protein YcdF (DUF218 family)
MRFLLKRALPLAFLVWALAVSVAFALRHGERPVDADAVVVLQGSSSRLPEGLKLVRAGYAPLLVVSRGDHKKLAARLCRPGQTIVHARVLCFDADPVSTRGEAQFIGRLARERGLERIDVVTSQFHVFRAQILLERCYDGELRMVGSSQEAWKFPWYALTETVKLAYQLVAARGC